MTTFRAVQPDLEFIADVRASGGETVKRCFQCATCSVVCAIAPDRAPYPRKEMIWAQWGMTDRLAGDSHVWLCHQCNDCSAHCPRGAKPGEVMGGVRAALIKRFAVPRVLGEMVHDLTYLPIVLLIPAVLLYALIQQFGYWGIPDGEVEYAKFLPHMALEPFFGGMFFLMMFSMFLSGRRFWRAVCAGTAMPTGEVAWTKATWDTLVEVLTHSRFKRCTESKGRFWGHISLFYGFAALFFVTGVVVIFAVLGLYPLTLWHPLKVLGNVAGIALLTGTALLVMDRADREAGGQHAYFDWFFLILLLVLGTTGMLLVYFRLIVETPEAAYPTYYVHLVAVFLTILYLPYTKFAHLYYRFLAMVHARMAGIPTGATETAIKAA
jgi:quinone-modifying oxidoreductase subunit QmoC